MKREYDFSNAERGRFYQPNARLRLPTAPRRGAWIDHGGAISDFIATETEKTLRSYGEQPSLVTEHANHEHDTMRGGYAHRQLFELVQNSADAIHGSDGGSILVRLTGEHLYCADDGRPITADGVRALMFSHLSPKRNTTEIGRFGLGFKSVLGVSDGPEFYSREGSFRFDRQHAADRIGQVAPAERYPVLRLPRCISAQDDAARDEDLAELMTWATNIVRLPLKAGAHDDLNTQIKEFPAEFLLFVDHVRHLALESGDVVSRDIHLDQGSDVLILDTGSRRSRWKCFETTRTLSSAALHDRRSLDDGGEVSVRWAVPLDRLNEPGYFWHFFPTKTSSLVAGILNAPWKTNEDRQNLLPGLYNDELIDAAAMLVAEHLHELADGDDPALHLDALPRRREAPDTEQSIRLRDKLDILLTHCAIAPDQAGQLRSVDALHYAPAQLPDEALEAWESAEHRSFDWVHRRALTTTRIAKLDRLHPDASRVPRASASQWLEALVVNVPVALACEASKAALRVVASMPAGFRRRPIGKVVLTQASDWAEPDPEVIFLPRSDAAPDIDGSQLVHSGLASDLDAVSTLSALGIRSVSPKTYFEIIADSVLVPEGVADALWRQFWSAARKLGADAAADVIGPKRRHMVHALTLSGDWETLCSALLPGCIVSGDDHDDDTAVTIDTDYHGSDLKVLAKLGAASTPLARYDFTREPGFRAYQDHWRGEFCRRDLPQSPQLGKLVFDERESSGPLHLLERLSDRGKALYTEALLSMEETFASWTMRHKTRELYQPFECDSPAVTALRRYGRIRCTGDYVPLADALGHPPANGAALMALLALPMARHIREAFDLATPAIAPVGEEDPIPLVDAWPGLNPHLLDALEYDLVRCLRIADDDTLNIGCLLADKTVYLVTTGDDFKDLRAVCREVGLDLVDADIEKILAYITPQQVDAARARIRASETDADRLALAVGESTLRAGLPAALVATLEASGAATPAELAEAAIATFHTSALHHFRKALDPDLQPPRRWAGSPRAVSFVSSLGFAPQWAGERKMRRAPFVDVEAPVNLPPLHSYQEVIAGRLRTMLVGCDSDARRGMLSLPTGAGKTRVAVEAIVKAMADGFVGGVLWVADRDELCEQAVEAWRQVWSSTGIPGVRLRISRMWSGQPRPMPESDQHVVVASIQTLNARLTRRTDEYAFLSDFKLVVFDEAHRSVAPTFTTVMSEIGFTRRQSADEPFLIGLTATPYRGHDERETQRLVRRYGGYRLDGGAFDSSDPVEVVRELQNMRVIAEADHEVIEGGDLRLNAEELLEIRDMPTPAWLPRSVELRIARDTARTQRIVSAYRQLVGDSFWPTLVFATSVEHAQTVAALLNAQGVPSRAVSGSTESAVRRSIVEEFRAGRIRVLVNYGVFREGFDAPKTRVIIVARPVYSPNLYFQMIGRGLRGPKNGGNARCLIVNVRDNIENFERQLAFSELDWLWRPSSRVAVG